ncbi:MAG: manganese efflux pump MntP family protein [bacterium]
MNLLTILIVALGLSMDAFAVSVARGITIKELRVRNAFTIAMFFGSFQALMPMLGWWAGLRLRDFIAGVDHWIAFGLLLGVGMKMIYDGLRSEQVKQQSEVLSFSLLFLLSIATSIDALAVGLSFAFLAVSIVTPSMLIGLVTFCLSFVGVLLGERTGCLLAKRAEIIGGSILIVIGIKIVLEHLGYLG